MIRVLVSDPDALEADAILRSVGTDLEACTPLEQRLGLQAGLEILDRLRDFGEVPVGGALVTPGGGLRAPFVIHVVIRSGEEGITEQNIRRALLNGLRQADQWGLETLTILPLGTGAGNLEAESSARIMMAVLKDHYGEAELPRDVVIAVPTEYEEDAFLREVVRTFPDNPPREER